MSIRHRNFGSILFGGIITVLSFQSLHAQNIENYNAEIPFVENEKGVYLVLNEQAFTESNNFGLKEIIIYRQNAKGKYVKLNTVTPAASWNDITKKINNKSIEYLQKLKQLKDGQQLWEYINQHTTINEESYGMLIGDLKFMEALGMAWLDSGINNLGNTLHYKLEYIGLNKEKTKIRENSYTLLKKAKIEKPVITSIIEKDSVIGMVWGSKFSQESEAFMAEVYRREWPNGSFTKIKNILANVTANEDSVYYNLNDKVQPDKHYTYYLLTRNKYGLKGEMSDSAEAIAFNFKNIRPVQGVKIFDTLSGIRLTWDSVAQPKYIVGIVIEKSVEPANDFKIVDTVSLYKRSYFDDDVIPATKYTYRLNLLTIRQNLVKSPTKISGFFKGSNLPIESPENVKAVSYNDSICITWNKLISNNVQSYYVYRSLAEKEAWQKVSDFVYDGKFTDTSLHSSLLQYKYMVKAVAYSGIQSKASLPVFGQLTKAMKPLPVIGLKGYNDASLTTISWKPLFTSLDEIASYNVYRKDFAQPDDSIQQIIPLSNLTSSGFKKVNTDTIKNAVFFDYSAPAGHSIYTITAVSKTGGESDASSFINVKKQGTIYAPMDMFSLSSSDKMAIISWDLSLQNGIIGYKIFRRSLNDSKPNLIATVDASTNQFQDLKVEKNKTYYYSVQVQGQDAASVVSNEKRILIR